MIEEMQWDKKGKSLARFSPAQVRLVKVTNLHTTGGTQNGRPRICRHHQCESEYFSKRLVWSPP